MVNNNMGFKKWIETIRHQRNFEFTSMRQLDEISTSAYA